MLLLKSAAREQFVSVGLFREYDLISLEHYPLAEGRH